MRCCSCKDENWQTVWQAAAPTSHTHTHVHREWDACESVLACGWLLGSNMCEWGTREQERDRQCVCVCDLAWRRLHSNSPTTRTTTATAACHWSVTSCDNRVLFANCTLHSVRKRGTKGWGERARTSVSVSGKTMGRIAHASAIVKYASTL